MKTTTSIFSTNLTRNLRTIATVTALALVGNLAIAQEPRPDRQSSGGGTTFNYGGIFNALKNALGGGSTNSNAKQPPVLQKRAESVSAVSGGNYTVNWVVSYANTSGQTLPTAQVQDGPIATIIPGSLKQPAGWTGSTNTNAPINNWATWTGTNVQPHGVMTASIPITAPPFPPLSGTSGDGYGPIPYTHSKGLRIYMLNHHLDHTQVLFDCIDAATRTRCATKPAGGTPWPRQLPQGGTNLTKVSGSLTAPEPLVLGSKMYYAWNHTSDGYGAGCFELETELPCGTAAFIPTQTNPKSNLSGPWKINNNLYFATSTGQVFCVDITSLTKCTGLTTVAIPTTKIKLKATQYEVNYNSQPIAGSVVGSRLILTSLIKDKDGGSWNNGDGEKYTNCFDDSSKTACWSTHPTLLAYPGTADVSHVSDAYANIISNGFLLNASNFIYYETNGTAKAICQLNDSHAYDSTNGQYCVKLIDGKNTTLSEIPNMWISAPNVLVRTQKEVHIWPKTYFTESRGNRAFCWDWSTASRCNSSASFAESGRPRLPSDGIRTGYTDNYAMKEDAQGCIWVYGDSYHLWNFDPQNLDANGKAQPCGGGSGGKSALIFQPLSYCSGPKPFHWTGVEIKSATLNNFDKFIVKVLDSTTNAVLMTKDLKATNATSVDTTSIDTQTLSKPFKIEVESTPKAGTSDKPSIEVRYDAPAPELCFQSMHTCQQGKVTNTVEATDPLDPKKTVKAQAEVAQPQSCGIPPCVPCGTAGTPTCPPCGQAGQEPCPVCDCVIDPPKCTPDMPYWPTCQPPKCTPDMPYWPTCQPPKCTPDMPYWPTCIPPTNCEPGTPNWPTCKEIVCAPGTPGWPLCATCANPPCFGTPPPPKYDPTCLSADCTPKPPISVGEEYKEPKVACVRKPKPVTEEPKKVVAPKPRPKPVVVTAPVVVDPNAPPPPPKPKPKPRPKAVPAKPAAEDDC